MRRETLAPGYVGPLCSDGSDSSFDIDLISSPTLTAYDSVGDESEWDTDTTDLAIPVAIRSGMKRMDVFRHPPPRRANLPRRGSATQLLATVSGMLTRSLDVLEDSASPNRGVRRFDITNSPRHSR